MALISCLVVMVCVIYDYPSTILSLIIFNFPSVFKIFLFAEILSTGFDYGIYL